MIVTPVRVIGITGGIGSGKSTVTEVLSGFGVQILDADALVHDIYAGNSLLLQCLTEKFGTEIVAADGTLDRKALGAIVFSDAAKLKMLESIIHPLVRDEMQRKIASFRKTGSGMLAVEAALLYEFAIDQMVDEVWVVVTDPQEAVKRAALRLGITQDQANQRLGEQMNPAEKADKADLIIANEDGIEALREKVREIFCRRYGITGGS